MAGFAKALGLKSPPAEGEAFDRDLQERRKQERIAERERAAKEKAAAEKARGARLCRVSAPRRRGWRAHGCRHGSLRARVFAASCVPPTARRRPRACKQPTVRAPPLHPAGGGEGQAQG